MSEELKYEPKGESVRTAKHLRVHVYDMHCNVTVVESDFNPFVTRIKISTGDKDWIGEMSDLEIRTLSYALNKYLNEPRK